MLLTDVSAQAQVSGCRHGSGQRVALCLRPALCLGEPVFNHRIAFRASKLGPTSQLGLWYHYSREANYGNIPGDWRSAMASLPRNYFGFPPK